MTKYYVDNQGKFLGAFQGSAPAGGTEVPTPPGHGKDTWNGSAWVPYVPPRVERLEALLEKHGVVKLALVLINELRARGAAQTPQFTALLNALDNEP